MTSAVDSTYWRGDEEDTSNTQLNWIKRVW